MGAKACSMVCGREGRESLRRQRPEQQRPGQEETRLVTAEDTAEPTVQQGRRLLFAAEDADEPPKKKAASEPSERWKLGKIVAVDCPRSDQEFAHLRDRIGGVAGSREIHGEVWYTVRFEGQTVERYDIPAKYLRLDGIGASSKDVTFMTMSKVFQSCQLHRIPVFQRRYCWGVEQFENMWKSVDDMTRADENTNNHSFGRLLLFVRPDKSRLVLDGQQRLTTMSLFISAMVNRLQALDEDALVRPVAAHIFGPGKLPRLIPTLDDREDFAVALTDPSPVGSGILLQCKRFFTKRLADADADRVMELAGALTNRVSALAFVVPNEESIQPLFENLAKRSFRIAQQMAEFKRQGIPTLLPPPPGVGMAYVDLIRNFVFEHFATEDEMRNEHTQWWSPMETAFPGNPELEAAFRHFLGNNGFLVDSEHELYGKFCAWWRAALEAAGGVSAAASVLSTFCKAIMQLAPGDGSRI
mmetsp:Transcript_21510/g.55005  ORF Transcript_21510/g.55005 Transcript_21510/m.55005 type:complete len:471 (-) Transcript_21510:160-1572(-)